MSTFALIHGAYGHGGLWERLAAELEARGHRAVAPDLPVDDPAARFADYADVVEAALAAAGADGDVVAVGHSLGAATAALVAARAPGRRVAYVAAVLPEPLRPVADVLRSQDVLLPGLRDAEVADGRGFRRIRPDLAATAMFAGLDADAARAAAAGLRPQALAPLFAPFPLDRLPSGPSVVCREDTVVSPDWGRAAARRLLGASAIELDGGHHPQLERPAELAQVLGA